MTGREVGPTDRLVTEALVQVVGDVGHDLIGDPRRVQAMLHDVLGSQGRARRTEIGALVLAVEQAIPEALLKGTLTAETAAHGLSHRGLDPSTAKFAIDAWRTALSSLDDPDSAQSLALTVPREANNDRPAIPIDTVTASELPTTHLMETTDVSPPVALPRATDPVPSRPLVRFLAGTSAVLLIAVMVLGVLVIRAYYGPPANDSSADADRPTVSADTSTLSEGRLSAGALRSCGVQTDGTVACWGHQVSSPEGQFFSVSVGDAHTCGIKTDQTIACWGADWAGRGRPLEGHFTALSSGDGHFCAITETGQIMCRGTNNDSRVNPPPGEFTDVAAGGAHSCAIRTDKTIACWGANWIVQNAPPAGRFTRVSAGGSHSCAIRVDEVIVCWGSDRDGQASPPEGRFVAVTAGDAHSCAIRVDEVIVCWGSDRDGQASPPEGRFVAVTAGDLHSCGIKTDRSILCWGDDGFGRVTTTPDGQFG